jgi:hypothetical protein
MSNSGPGVFGQSVTGIGVHAESDSGDAAATSSHGGVGLRAASDVNNGVFGETKAKDRAGVYGFAHVNRGSAVAGLAQGSDGVGVFDAATSTASGIVGQASAGGVGVTAIGETGLRAQGGTAPGIEAWSVANHGVSGLATDRLSSGVIGVNPTEGASGVTGMSTAGTGVYGQSDTGPGIYADSDSGTGALVYSQSGIGIQATAWGAKTAVVARNRGGGTALEASGGLGAQITGSQIGANIEGSLIGAGLKGDSCGANVSGKAVGLAASSDQIAVMANVYKGHAVVAASTEEDAIVGAVLQLGAAIHGKAGNPGAPSTYAGLFEGDVTINGTLRKSSDHFLIDHPLDPAGKFLEHSAVESNEMKNVYDGMITLDRRGRAAVRVPHWFETLNGQFRYQLTPIGRPAPNLHVAAELADGRFEIGGGTPRLKVSWQITGVRRDAWAVANPLRVERRKVGKERGRYLHPELFKGGPETGLFAATNPTPDTDKLRATLEIPAPPETGRREARKPTRRKSRIPKPQAPRAVPIPSTPGTTARK